MNTAGTFPRRRATLLRTPLLVGGHPVSGKVHERALPLPPDRYVTGADARNPSWRVVFDTASGESVYRGPGPVELVGLASHGSGSS